MKVNELISSCGINCSDMKEFKQCHPKQIISNSLPVPIWKIHYLYMTQRGNLKEADKYLIKDESAWDCIDNEFNIYIESINEKYPERKVSNVEILDATFLGVAEIPLE